MGAIVFFLCSSLDLSFFNWASFGETKLCIKDGPSTWSSR